MCICIAHASIALVFSCSSPDGPRATPFAHIGLLGHMWFFRDLPFFLKLFAPWCCKACFHESSFVNVRGFARFRIMSVGKVLGYCFPRPKRKPEEPRCPARVYICAPQATNGIDDNDPPNAFTQQPHFAACARFREPATSPTSSSKAPMMAYRWAWRPPWPSPWPSPWLSPWLST